MGRRKPKKLRQFVTHCSQSVERQKSANKIRRIVECVESGDLEYLRDLCLSGEGLVSGSVRARVWPALLGVDLAALEEPSTFIKEHPDTQQVDLDVRRSLYGLLGPQPRATRVRAERERLSRVINGVLSRHETMHYYQGLHDICSVLLLVVGSERVACGVAEQVCASRLRAFLEPTLDGALSILALCMPLLDLADPTLAAFLLRAGHADTHFALPWVITLFSHNCFGSIGDVERLFDLFFASHALMPLYVAVAVVLWRRGEILGSECEFAAVHGLMAKFPARLRCEEVVGAARELDRRFPPAVLFRHAEARASSAAEGAAAPRYRRALRRLGLGPPRDADTEMSAAAERAAEGLSAAVRIGSACRARQVGGRISRRGGGVGRGEESAGDRVMRYALFLITATATGVVGFAVREALAWA